jgi:hypothetical protein
MNLKATKRILSGPFETYAGSPWTFIAKLIGSLDGKGLEDIGRRKLSANEKLPQGSPIGHLFTVGNETFVIVKLDD